MNSIRLSPFDWEILLFLWQHGPSTPESIYRHLVMIDLGQPQPSFLQITAILDKLCLSGYLQDTLSDETYLAIVPRSVLDRWYYRLIRAILWRISSWLRLEWLYDYRQHTLGFDDHQPEAIPGASKLPSPFFKISLAHPRLLSKRFTSSFVVQIYLPTLRRKVSEKLKAEFEKQQSVEHLYDSQLTPDHVIRVKLFSPEMVFSDPVTRKLENKLNTISFLGRPKDACYPGVHQATLSVCDEQTNQEYQSANFPIQIVDFAFDHISRPLLTNCMTVILGIGSLAMFILTLLGQIDNTFGLTSGSTAGALASAVYIRFLLLYKHSNVSKQP